MLMFLLTSIVFKAHAMCLLCIYDGITRLSTALCGSVHNSSLILHLLPLTFPLSMLKDSRMKDRAAPNPRWGDRFLVLLVFSLTLNLVLAHGIWRKLRSRSAAAPTTQSATAPARDSSPRTTSSLQPTDAANPARFSWTMLQSLDARTYANRLRAAECPPAVVRELVIAQLARQREELCARIPPPPFWANPAELRAARVRAFQEETEITRRFDALATEALGVRWLEKPLDASDMVLTEVLIQALMGPVTRETTDDFRALGHRLERQQSQLRTLPLLAAYRERTQSARWREQAFNALLSGGQQQEVMKRIISLTLIMASGSGNDFPLTGAELERVSGVLASQMNLVDLNLDADDEIRGKLLPALAQALPAERLRDFLRSRDPDYQAAIERDESGREISSTKAQQLYEIKAGAEKAWLAVQNDPALDDATRQRRLDDIRRGCTLRTRQLLGAEPFRNLQHRRPYWVLTEEEEQQ